MKEIGWICINLICSIDALSTNRSAIGIGYSFQSRKQALNVEKEIPTFDRLNRPYLALARLARPP